MSNEFSVCGDMAYFIIFRFYSRTSAQFFQYIKKYFTRKPRVKCMLDVYDALWSFAEMQLHVPLHWSLVKNVELILANQLQKNVHMTVNISCKQILVTFLFLS